MKNQDLIELNELNKNSNGGTELITRELFDRLDRSELEPFQIITSRVRELKEEKLRVLHLHDLPLDPENAHLKEEKNRNRFHKMVFVSNWQYQQFRDYLGVPYDLRSTVIPNGFEPIEMVRKEKDKIRLIYTSTPHRGLEILVPVFEALAANDPNIVLDVYSSFGIYGWPERDKQYEPLFERCKNHPQINYHGWQPNEVVREALQKAHIFAYPCIWQETFCRAMVEAMSAGCVCVHPNFSALPEVSGGMNVMYDGDHVNHNAHATTFAHSLLYAIQRVRQHDLTPFLEYVKNYTDTRYSWENTIPRWKSLLASLRD